MEGTIVGGGISGGREGVEAGVGPVLGGGIEGVESGVGAGSAGSGMVGVPGSVITGIDGGLGVEADGGLGVETGIIKGGSRVSGSFKLYLKESRNSPKPLDRRSTEKRILCFTYRAFSSSRRNSSR